MRALTLLIALSLLACREPEPTDLDGDGVEKDEDCNDLDPDVFPGADELCNGVDDDCDGDVDEEAVDALTWYMDGDEDGYGDEDLSLTACEAPSGYIERGGDCNDSDAAFHPGAPETDCTDPSDYSCDGSVGYADADGDGWAACEECDDSEATVHPEADEVCNDVDDDCDGEVDDHAIDAPTWYLDADSDTYGTSRYAVEECDQPAGYVSNAEDCDDLRAAAHPGADETCNEADDDCDGEVDEDPVDPSTFYADADGDGYGDPASTTQSCQAPSGTTEDDSDCDDTDATISPDGTEVCDEADNDCDGTVDEDDATDAATWYADWDGDGYGSARITTLACDQPSAYVADSTDCDDFDDDTYPGADETCDGDDDDCDGTVDEEAIDASTWYADSDGDGFGDPDVSTEACDEPSGYTDDDSDCDDDAATTSPVALEVCDGADNDCDGDVDDGAVDADTWYGDDDGDGYGESTDTVDSCDQPSGYADEDGDCDDTDSAVSPAALEVCNGIDDDCDGYTDDDDPYVDDPETWYEDADEDGYGDAASTTEACEAPSGYTDDATDCDDLEAAVNPGESEICDALDNDCDGDTDEGVLGSGSSCPAIDCAEIIADQPSATDDWYSIDPDGSGSITVYCDMSTDGGGWTLVADYDFSTDACPGSWVKTSSAGGLCWRNMPSTAGQVSASFDTCGISYDEVMGHLTAYQWWSEDAFGQSRNSSYTIDQEYVDGLSLTHGSTTRTHVFSWGIGLTPGYFSAYDCPADGGESPPSYVGSDYFCDNGNSASSWTNVWYSPLLFSGDWFQVTLPASTTDDLEGRIMANQGSEDMGVSTLEIYVR